MIPVTGSFTINASASKNRKCDVAIVDHPFKDNDVVKFETSVKKVRFFSGNYLVLKINNNTIGLKDFPNEALITSNNKSISINVIDGKTGECTVTLQQLRLPASKAISPEIQSLEPSAIIELFKLTFDKDVNGQTIPPYYYHAGTNELKGKIIFDGITYEPVPVKVEGFDKTTKGTLPRPRFTVANTNSAISALLILYNPLKAEVLRIQTCKKFLDADNFTSNTNDNADPDAVFEVDDRWYVDRVAIENPNAVVFELSGKISLTNLKLPQRKFRESKVKV
tara:strand:- start:832 stop:1671 length:840 start_codon:yes stop_codon:yes gene_type:complete